MTEASLRVDEPGLARVLSEWSGVGGLYRAVAAMADVQVEREWTRDDIERRAMRILLVECTPMLRRWPQSLRIWQDHLPTLSLRKRFWSDVPQARVDWARTRRTGWPPTAYAIRRRHRSTDQVTLTVLAWTLGQLERALDASQSLTGPHAEGAAALASDVEVIVEQTLPLLRLLDEAGDSVPTRDDVRAVRGAGWPWKVVGEVAEVFLALERGGADALARRLLRPDGFPDAIFQLSVLGAVLNACEARGARIVSLRPIGHLTDGPVYRVDWPDSPPWEVWCEAAAAWACYELEDTYRNLAATMTKVSGTSFSARNIRPDIVIAAPGQAVAVLECKYPFETLDPGYVGHGLYQAAFYAHQMAPKFPNVLGASIGPKELVPTSSFMAFGGVRLGLASPDNMRDIVAWLVAAANSREPSATGQS